MNIFRPVHLCLALAGASISLQVHADRSQGYINTQSTMTRQIKNLKAAKNVSELMELLRNIHEQGLLIDPGFIKDENISRLFGLGEIKTSSHKFSSDYASIRKELFASFDSSIRLRIVITGVIGSPRSGGIFIDKIEQSNIGLISHELIENSLLPGVQGYDPYDPKKAMTNEFRNFVGGLPLATHPKGYWKYWHENTNLEYKQNRVIVELNRNADVSEINLEQGE